MSTSPPGKLSTSTRAALMRSLSSIVGDASVLTGEAHRHYLSDATDSAGVVRGHADAIVKPSDATQASDVLSWCYREGVPIVARGGGTGYAGGAVPNGGVVLSLENLNSVHAFDPLQWRIHVGAGVRTASIHRLARENGLFFPPDPGAAEQSQIGGNVATNAGGPHAFKYGVTGAWVTGLEVVFPPGNLVRIGGPLRKDVAGYDLRSLIVGSEGTLAIITSVWLRLLPAPALALPVAAFFTDAEAGCAAIERVFGYGLTPATLEYFEGQALMIAQRGLPFQIPDETTFLVLSEADGRPDAARELQHELREALGEDALDVWAPQDGPATDGLQRWRDGVSLAVAAARGGKRSEDISVPVDRIRDAITRTLEIGKLFDLPACSWGHAGDGNLHCTFMIDPSNEEERQRAEAAAAEVLTTALDLGGSISGEHGVGQMKRKAHINSTEKHKLELYRALKLTFDPKGLLNPDKKV